MAALAPEHTGLIAVVQKAGSPLAHTGNRLLAFQFGRWLAQRLETVREAESCGRLDASHWFRRQNRSGDAYKVLVPPGPNIRIEQRQPRDQLHSAAEQAGPARDE